MRPVELTNRDLVSHDGSRPPPWEPDMKMKCRGVDLERRCAQLGQIKIDSVIRCRADRAGGAGKHRQRRAVNVTACNQPDTRMSLQDERQVVGIT